LRGIAKFNFSTVGVLGMFASLRNEILQVLHDEHPADVNVGLSLAGYALNGCVVNLGDV